MTLRPATPADLDAICALEAAGFDHAGWSRDSWAAEIDGAERDGATRFVCVVQSSASKPHVEPRPRRAPHVDGSGADVPALPGVATFSRLEDVAELLRVVVAPTSRGRGWGTALVASGIEWATGHGARRMLLEVEEINTPARALYDRTGFVVIARRQNYYGTGHHALVMEKELGNE